MDFLGVGPLELILILIIGLIVLGPGKLPHMARSLGKGIAAFRKAYTDVTTEVSKELEELAEDEDNSKPEEHSIDKPGKSAGRKSAKNTRRGARK